MSRVALCVSTSNRLVIKKKNIISLFLIVELTFFCITGAAHRFAESEVTIHYRSPIRNLQQSGQQQVHNLRSFETILNLIFRNYLIIIITYDCNCRRKSTRKNWGRCRRSTWDASTNKSVEGNTSKNWKISSLDVTWITLRELRSFND